MTTIIFELVIDFDSQYTPAKPAVLYPPPGEPPEPEEILVNGISSMRLDGCKVEIDKDLEGSLIDLFMEHKAIRKTIEEAIREDA